jgi:catalase
MNSTLGLGAFPHRRTFGVLAASLLTFSVHAAT